MPAIPLPHDYALARTQAYTHHFDLLPVIRFNTRVVSLTQDPSTACWTVVVQDLVDAQKPLYTLQASFLVKATGSFSRPFVPAIEVRGGRGCRVHARAPSRV